MVHKQDYILRMIEMMGDFFRKLKSLASDTLAEESFTGAYLQFTGLRRAIAEELDVDTLGEMLPPERLLALAELTAMRAARFENRYDEDTLGALRLRALRLYLRIEDDLAATLITENAITCAKAAHDALPLEELPRAIVFFTRAEKYNTAENILFSALERFATDANALPPLLAAGEDFYATLSALPDEALFLSGFRREEISEGLRDLHSIAQTARG